MRVVKQFGVVLAAILLLIVPAAKAVAQAGAEAQISGRVMDPTGAAIPNVQINVTNVGTGQVRTVSSAANGLYIVTNLPVGSYKIEAQKTGFSTYVQVDLKLQVGDAPTINLPMSIGSVTQTVTVQADAVAVDTTSSSTGQVIDQQRIVDLPLNGRDPIQMALLTGAAQLPTGQSTNFALSGRGPVQAYNVLFNGQDGTGSTYTLDGANHNDGAENTQFPLPFPDALQEFRVETNYPARYGMHAAATVNAVTKSGANQFHGDVFEFVRNYIFNARNYFATTRDNLKRNQFGGVVGGPIIKDKLFFFGGYQYTTIRSANPVNVSFVPTAAMLTGDFTAAAAAGCFTGTLKAPFVGNKIAPSQFSLPSVNLSNLVTGQITPTNACGRVQYPIAQNNTNTMATGKVDYHLKGHTIFARYIYAATNKPYDPSLLLAQSVASISTTFDGTAIGDTYLINDHLVNSLIFAVNRSTAYRGAGINSPTPTSLGVQNFYSPYPKLIIFNASGAFTLAGATGSAPADFNMTDPQIDEDLTFIHKSHQFGFGFQWVDFAQNCGEPTGENGTFNFASSFTGYSLADFLMGDLSSGSGQQGYYNLDIHKDYFGYYAQDSWKATHKLTINYGLRWEPFYPFAWSPKRNTGGPAHFEPANYASGTTSTVYTSAPAGMMFPGDAGYTVDSSRYPHLKNFAPRVGFAFDPGGNGKSVIRGGFGIFYNTDYVGLNFNWGTGAPYGSQIQFASGANFSNPWNGFVFNGHAGEPFPLAPGSFPAGAAYQSSPLHPPMTYSQQWNLSYERQLGSEWSFTVSYAANTTVHLARPTEGNPGVYIPGSTTSANLSARRLLTQENATRGANFSQLVTFVYDNNGNYNGFSAKVQKQFSKNYSILANYTYAHCIDTFELTSALVSPPWEDPRGALANRGNCSYDKRQLFNMSGVVQTPRVRQKFVNAITEKWQLSPIFTAQSGDWLTVSTGTDDAFYGVTAGQRPNQTCDPRVSSHPHTSSTIPWFNPACFANATAPAGFTGNVVPASLSNTGTMVAGPLGNVRRSSMLGPGFWNLDTSLSRTFPIWREAQLQVRAEAFNVFNHTKLPDPVVAKNSTGFGSIITAPAGSYGFSTPYDPRIMQFAMKIIF